MLRKYKKYKSLVLANWKTVPSGQKTHFARAWKDKRDKGKECILD